ncbi:MAG: hypothetical protein ACI9VT_003130 [Psychroserpens sp.]|jgi:uncharacterized protein (TIGR02246 family)
MHDNEILALFEQWNDALQTRIPKNVTTLYEESAILLPTLSNNICQNHKEMNNYFSNLMTGQPVAKIVIANIDVFDQVAINSGVYTFTFKDGNTIDARFTFVYRWNGERWMIIHHHSSKMPE